MTDLAAKPAKKRRRKRKRRIWILYDGRAHTEGTERAAVLVTCDSHAEARDYMETWPDAAVYRYDLVKKAYHDLAINERYCPEFNDGTAALQKVFDDAHDEIEAADE